MLEDDFKRMMEYFHQTIEGKPLNMQELCTESLQFFEKVKHSIERGTDKEKEEAMQLMAEMYKKLVTECKQLTEKTGMSEEQIMSFAENPNNFSQEQWELLQDTRQNMARTGEALASFLQKQPSSIPPARLPKPPSTEKKKIHKLKKSNWMRS